MNVRLFSNFPSAPLMRRESCRSMETSAGVAHPTRSPTTRDTVQGRATCLALAMNPSHAVSSRNARVLHIPAKCYCDTKGILSHDPTFKDYTCRRHFFETLTNLSTGFKRVLRGTFQKCLESFPLARWNVTQLQRTMSTQADTTPSAFTASWTTSRPHQSHRHRSR